MKASKDLFVDKSKHWDQSSRRVQNAQNIANKILENIDISREMALMDFGAGTGLLSYALSHHAGKIIAVDNSPSMLEALTKKIPQFECPIEPLLCDLTSASIDQKFDGIISSMTLHHIANLESLFDTFYTLLRAGGFIALADLDVEDGTFHDDNTGVYHHGLDRKVMEEIAQKSGFGQIQTVTAHTIQKPKNDFTVFLLTAFKY
jgi:tRNA (cmo5U34)-methyltransferase